MAGFVRECCISKAFSLLGSLPGLRYIGTSSSMSGTVDKVVRSGSGANGNSASQGVDPFEYGNATSVESRERQAQTALICSNACLHVMCGKHALVHDVSETFDSGQLGHIGPGKNNLQNFEPCGCKRFLQLMDLGLDPGKTGIALSVCDVKSCHGIRVWQSTIVLLCQ